MIKLDVHNPKGGSGKTTLALNLAVAFAQQGARVLLVDRDPQGSALTFARIAEKAGRELPFVVSSAAASGFDVYLFDHAPGLVERYASRLVVMPTLLDSQSFLVYKRGRAFAEEEGRVVIPVAMRYRQDRSEQRLIASSLQAPLIRDRAVYSNAYGRGETVFSSTRAYANHAQAEILAVVEAITNTLSNPYQEAA